MPLAKTPATSAYLASRNNKNSNQQATQPLGMEPDAKKVFKTLSLSKIWFPLGLGVGAALYLSIKDGGFSKDSLSLMAKTDWRYLLLVLLVVIVRDLGYIQRIRLLTHKRLSWLSSFYVIVLWEFSSAVTPSVVGGSVVAIFLLFKEQIKLGKALAYVIVTSIFDNLFFMGAASLGLFGVYDTVFAGMSTLETRVGNSLRLLFWSSYLLVSAYTIVMLLAIFVKPQFFRWLLIRATRIRFLRRWQQAAKSHGDEIVLASEALQGERLTYWLKVGLATLVTWSARYLVLNLIIAACVPLNFADHLAILGKQVIMWTIMLVSPTPGSSGTAEFFHSQLYGSHLGGYTLITAVTWRALTYYLYLVLGIICLPRWIKRTASTAQREQ